ncbi:SagB/ThcOx family dehydrogenase [Lentzea sp. PSKA42]|uniref:SagB/ThcOx family dehydrogenase n=1 Tax=Lentzea indica TaxID=2604800 RepID=A0ABX1FSI3_9PSEU|nr:SagB family peptide dehydrogenase [Lentzea indica]NKE61453.1 SagB/ThcOx family dehydrogenase [Lentzea indica]
MRTLIRLRAGVVVRTCPDGTTRLVSRTGAESLGALTPAQAAVLAALESDRDERDLLAANEASQVYALLMRLRRGNWLAATLVCAGTVRLTVHPTGGRHAANLTALLAIAEPQDSAVLSRFAVLRREDDHLVLESPRSGFTVHLDDPSLLDMDDPVVRHVLCACGLAVLADADEASAWSPHELWFHARTRQGRHEYPWGATRRFSPPPGRWPTGPGLPLLKPDVVCDVPLTEAMETRRSIRVHDAIPLTAAQLGEFLFRTARTRCTWSLDGVQLLDRPYPSAGALHELEIYPVVRDVTGVPQGLYHYDSHDHRLVPVEADESLVARLAGNAAAAARMTGQPQVLFVITARFGRVMWKYESMGYALTLKNVGVLMSAMYLVATAMRLAPCAVGGGDADLFAAAAGLDYETESSVGEFVLGSAPSPVRCPESSPVTFTPGRTPRGSLAAEWTRQGHWTPH